VCYVKIGMKLFRMIRPNFLLSCLLTGHLVLPFMRWVVELPYASIQTTNVPNYSSNNSYDDDDD
jgi:hypothetical protein